MATSLGQAAWTIVVGLLVGGLLASLSVVAAPPQWRGPWIPRVAGAAGLLLAALIRWLMSSCGAEPRGDGNQGRRAR
jgi:hypothetical protein